MSKRLTIKQRKFTQEYLRSGNGTGAVLKTYNTKSSVVAASIAHENLRKPQIKDLIDEHALDAAKRMGELIRQDKSLSVAFQASKDTLDRAGYKSSTVHRDDSKIRQMTDQELEEEIASTFTHILAKIG
ncbi:MAG: terminase small subunit [Patescibacteria group bacterium]|mgnify:CR=1 FL=1